MSDDTEIKSLKKRLDKARGSRESQTVDNKPKSTGMAWRIGVELFVAVGVGFFIGQQLDIWADTKPLFLIIFTLLGFGAGIKNVMVLAKRMQEAAEAEDKS